ncbi:efflux RND transporter periplasmic adaptor subunit [Acinetobacter larvae]
MMMIIIILLVIFMAYQFLKSSPKQIAEEGPAAQSSKAVLSVNTVRPERQNWPQQFNANGNVAAWQEVVIGSELSGQRITKVMVNVGDHVRKGQLLAEINSDSIRAELASAQANAAEAQAVLAEAKANLTRIQQLKDTGAISKQEANQYLTTTQTAQAKLDAAKAQINSQKIRLQQTQIIASDQGVISARTATVGSLAQAGQEMFRLIRDNRLEWQAEVTSTDLYQLKPGMSVKVIPPDPNQAAIKATVRMLPPAIDPQNRYGLVYVDLPPNNALRMGMYVKGEFDLGDKMAITVPQSAILMRDGFSYVFIISPDKHIRQQKVSIGRRLNDRVEVLDLANADNVNLVAAGVGFLADGDLVSISKAIPDTPLTKQLTTEQEK